MPRRSNAAGRRRSVRSSLPVLLIVCSGESTEQAYLDGLRSSVRNKVVQVKLDSKPRAPLQVVDYAIKRRRQSLEEVDELWCVFDVDHYEIDGAVRLAAEQNVELAISTPCFELWLLLHLEDCATHLADYKAVARRLKKHLPKYDKRRLDFGDYVTGVADAIRRAEKLGDSGNPSTGMWRLATRIHNEEDE
jgi:hypothetical protein